ITVHPRPDQRHIRPGDVVELAELLRAYPAAEYNIEGNPFHGLLEHCEHVRPAQATLVPDAREAFTSNHGWNLIELDATSRAALARSVSELKALGCRVSLFLDPVTEMMPIARAMGADRVELYTELYAAAAATGRTAEPPEIYGRAAAAARAACLGVNAGHDLNLQNLGPFVQGAGPIDEVSIGHSLIADALELGMAETVRRYLSHC